MKVREGKSMPQKMAVMFSTMLVGCALTLSAAGSTVIGMVSSGAGQAGISIDGARVSGNATLFEGSVVSSSGYSRLELSSGTRVDLGADSVVRVFANHVSLEGGSSEVQSASHYAIDARSLRVEPAETGSIARVRLDGDQRVLVTALSAPVNVWNSNGLLVARVTPAMPLSFLPQAASGAFNNTGCVVNKSKAAVFVDQTGNQVFELRSKVSSVDLRKFVGKRATVTGTMLPSATPVQGATQVVNVSAIAPATGGDCAPVAARIGATTTSAGLAAGGAAAAAGGAAAAGTAAGATAGISGAVVAGVSIATAAAIGTAVGVAVANTSP